MASPLLIPDHELLHPIGRGSYGEVWLARSVLGTMRAVKLVRRDELNGARPFEREYLGIQRFEPISRSHEGLVDVLQVGRNDAAGFFYYVMELADEAPGNDGARYVPRTLASDLARLRRLPPAECIRLFHHLASALAHLHRAGLVHRDIKPANIVFVNEAPKFADIGLVALADGSLSYVGTEGFIAPEGAGTVAGDIYAFGKVLYECGTGRDRKEFPALPPELIESDADQGLLELNAIWLKACALSPSDRYPNAEELAADLAILQAGRSVKGLRAAESRLVRARRLSRVAAVIALTALAGVMLVRRQAARERERGEHEKSLRVRAELAEKAVERQLSKSRVAQARAILESRRIGRSAEVLALLTNRISPETLVQARSLAASALSLPDLLPVLEDAGKTPRRPPAIQPQADGAIWVFTNAAVPGAARTVVPTQGEPVRDPLRLDDTGRYLYAGYGEYTERIWDLSTGRRIAELGTNYYSLEFRPHHAEAAVAYVNGDVTLHQLPGWEVKASWPVQAGEGFVRWSSDGEYLLFPKQGQSVGVLQPDTGRFVASGDIHALVTAQNWEPGGRIFAVASDDGYVRVRNLDAGEDFTVLARHEARIIDAIFLPPFPWLLSSSWDGTSRLWDWHAGHELGRIEATGTDISYDPVARELSWRLGGESEDHRWRFNGSGLWRQFTFGNPRVIGGPFMASFSADNRFVAIPDTDFLRVWNLATETEVLRLPGYSQAVWLSPDGGDLLAVMGKAVRHWKLSCGRNARLEARELPAFGPAEEGAKFAVDRGGDSVALIGEEKVDLWVHGEHTSWVHGVSGAETIAISPDGGWLAVGTRNRVGLRVFNTRSRELAWMTELRYGTHPAFSWDGRWLAVGTDQGCHVYEAGTGRVRWEQPAPGRNDPRFWEVAFSPDGSLLASTSKASRIELLDALTGREILTLDYPVPRFITGLVFSADGRWLAETSNKHVLHLWDVAELRARLTALGLGW